MMSKKTLYNYILLFCFLALFMIWLWHFFSPYGLDPVYGTDGMPIENANPSFSHPFGTDDYGVDVLVKLSMATSYNLLLSLMALIAFLSVGIPMGIALGFRPSQDMQTLRQLKYKWDNKRILVLRFLQWTAFVLNNIFQTIPIILVMIVTVLSVQRWVEEPGLRLYIDMAVLGIFYTPKIVITLQDRILRLRKEEFIHAAKAMGMSFHRLIFKHILWHECYGVIIVQSLNILLQAIMMEIFLTYFNYGSDKLSLGILIKQYMGVLPAYLLLTNQERLASLVPFILVILICLTFRWLGERVLELSEV